MLSPDQCTTNMNNTRVYKMSFAGVYPLYIQKAQKKGRTKAEVDQIIVWLTGYTQQAVQQHLDNKLMLKLFSLKRY